MMRKKFEIIGYSPLLQLLFLVGFIILGVLLFQFLLASVLFLFSPIGVSELLDIKDLPPMWANFIVVFNQFGMFLFPAVVFGIFYQREMSLKSFYVAPQAFNFKRVLIFLLFIPTVISSVDLFEFVNYRLFKLLPSYFSEILDQNMESSQSTLIHLMTSRDSWSVFLQVFAIALIPALAEELFFRGVLMRLFYRFTGNIHASILTVALFFAVLHFQFHYLIPMWYMGIILGYTYYWTGSIIYPIILHFINNATAIYLYHIGTPEVVEYVKIPALIMTLFLPGVLYLMYRNKNKNALNSWYRN